MMALMMMMIMMLIVMVLVLVVVVVVVVMVVVSMMTAMTLMMAAMMLLEINNDTVEEGFRVQAFTSGASGRVRKGPNDNKAPRTTRCSTPVRSLDSRISPGTGPRRVIDLPERRGIWASIQASSQ